MKTLIINASPREGGNTSIMIDAITKVLNKVIPRFVCESGTDLCRHWIIM